MPEETASLSMLTPDPVVINYLCLQLIFLSYLKFDYTLDVNVGLKLWLSNLPISYDFAKVSSIVLLKLKTIVATI